MVYRKTISFTKERDIIKEGTQASNILYIIDGLV